MSLLLVMDSRSEINIITPRCCRKLNLKGVPAVMNIGAGGITNTIRTEIAEVTVKDKYGEETITECMVLNKACGKILAVDEVEFDENDKQLLREKLVYTHRGEIDLLIGISLHEQLSFQKLRNGLSLIETKLGYCLAGTLLNASRGNYERGPSNVDSCLVILIQTDDEHSLSDYLQAELVGINMPTEDKSDEETQFELKMKLVRDNESERRFRVSLPWKIEPSTFHNNREQAINRDAKLVKQLKYRKVEELFDAQIKEMVKTGILKEVDEELPKHYLPLLAVIDLQRDSTKV